MKTYKEWAEGIDSIETQDSDIPDQSRRFRYPIDQLTRAIAYLEAGNVRLAKDAISRALDQIH